MKGSRLAGCVDPFLLLVVVGLSIATGVGGCRGPGASGPYQTPADGTRDTRRAEALNREAADLLKRDPDEAGRILREALTADLFYGPAHNNLGVLYLADGKLYEAAHEFEWARKLMPGHPDPRVNLAITLERAGRVDDALGAYTAALEVWPGYLPAIQGLAALTVREGRDDERLAAWLEEIAMRAEAGEWSAWAMRQRASPAGRVHAQSSGSSQ